MIRNGVGCLGLVVFIALATLLPFLWLFGNAFGGGEGLDRALLLIGLLAFLALAATVAALSGRAPAAIARSPVAWAAGVVTVAWLLWAFVILDSARAVRSLPEAQLTYPGAVETNEYSVPSSGGIDGDTPARFVRAFHVDDSFADVLAFYTDRLAAAGWDGPRQGIRRTGPTPPVPWEWERDAYRLVLEFPSDPSAGEYTVVIWGSTP